MFSVSVIKFSSKVKLQFYNNIVFRKYFKPISHFEHDSQFQNLKTFKYKFGDSWIQDSEILPNNILSSNFGTVKTIAYKQIIY